MAFDISQERAVKITDLADHLGLHVATVRAWCRKGFQGVRLESQCLPGGLITSWEAYERFTAAVEVLRAGQPVPRSPAARAAAAERAERELDEVGW